MSNENLSDIDPSGRVALSGVDETYRDALGDGTAKPGDAVGINSSGKVVQLEIGTSENFVGFLMPNISDSTDVDTAISDGDPCKVVVPKSGHTYAVQIEDPGGTEYEGQPYLGSDTAGAFEAAAQLTTAGVMAVLAADVANGDTYGKIRWL
jgi:hypothetical protein